MPSTTGRLRSSTSRSSRSSPAPSRASRRSRAGTIPSRGPISPADFIPIAEDTGMIRQLGRLVLAESCRQMAAWQRQFGSLAPGFMCVNVSAGQFGEHDLAAEVEKILDETGLEPSKLKLEITESAFLGDVGRAEATLAQPAVDGRRVEHRRFRHRLFVAQLSPPAPGEHRQGRSVFRQPHGRRCERLGDGSRHRRAGAQSGHGCRRRRGGKPRADGRAPNARLRACPGILLLATRRSSGSG